ncbi:MAG: sensor histidine kinase [Acidobacteriia bacterium]|nr:sensor histidine kinase [Terriglobia bacterium]
MSSTAFAVPQRSFFPDESGRKDGAQSLIWLDRAARLNECLEKEAKRMAQALHDEAGQLLSAVHIKLDQVARELPPEQAGSLEEVKLLLEQVEGYLRRLSHELHPMILDDLGLLPAIEFLIQGIASRSGLTITVEGSTRGRLPSMVETVLYRTVQEALTNAAKHARARTVRISLQRNGCVRCSIQDDGIGFDTAQASPGQGESGALGLRRIRERIAAVSGTLRLTSRPGRGTELLVTVPL